MLSEKTSFESELRKLMTFIGEDPIYTERAVYVKLKDDVRIKVEFVEDGHNRYPDEYNAIKLSCFSKFRQIDNTIIPLVDVWGCGDLGTGSYGKPVLFYDSGDCYWTKSVGEWKPDLHQYELLADQISNYISVFE